MPADPKILQARANQAVAKGFGYDPGSIPTTGQSPVDTRRVLIDTQVGLTTWIRSMGLLEIGIDNELGADGISEDCKFDFMNVMVRLDLKNSACVPPEIRERMAQAMRPSDLDEDVLAWIYFAANYEHERRLYSTLGAPNATDSIRGLIMSFTKEEGFFNPGDFSIVEKGDDGSGGKTMMTPSDRPTPALTPEERRQLRDIASQLPKMMAPPAPPPDVDVVDQPEMDNTVLDEEKAAEAPKAPLKDRKTKGRKETNTGTSKRIDRGRDVEAIRRAALKDIEKDVPEEESPPENDADHEG